MSHNFIPYTIDKVAGEDSLILMRNGYEIGTAKTKEDASLLAAQDALDAYPECHLDFIEDMAAEYNIPLKSCVQAPWFKCALADRFEKLMDIPEITNSSLKL
jgi:hypothetical protein